MNQKVLALLLFLSVALIPTQTSAVSAGTVAYKIAAGCGGVIFAKAAIGLGAASIITGYYATVGTFVTLLNPAGVNPVSLFIAVSIAGVSIGTGAFSYCCALLSYQCFQEMLAHHPEISHVHYYNHEKLEENNNIPHSRFANA